MSQRFPLGLGAVVFVKGPTQHRDRQLALTSLGLGEPDLGQLGIGEGHTRNDVIVHRHAQPKQRVPNDEAGMVIGDMGELRAAGDVADCVNTPVLGLEPLVDPNAATVVNDAGRIEIQAVGLGGTAGCNQEMAAFNRLFAIGLAHHDPDLGIHRFHTQHGNPTAKVDAFVRDLTENDVCALRIFAGERLRRLQHRHRRPEPAKGLRQLEAYRATSDDNEMVGPRDEIEDRLVGKVGGGFESRNGRQRGR